MQKSRIDKRVLQLLIFICGIFLLLAGYLTYFKLVIGDGILSNSYNRRQWEKEDNVLRGAIYDRNGKLLAKSEKKDGKNERVYPYGALYSHVIGYNSRAYGRTQLEAAFNDYLLGGGAATAFALAANPTKEVEGNTLYLTIDHRLQEKASDLLSGKNGAIVAMNPSTGEILAIVSKPDFDPNTQSLSDKWQKLAESDQHPFYSRATQGLYAPGSTFKIITAAAAIDNGLEGFTFEDTGSITIDGKVLSNSDGKANGKLDLKKAFAVSSNTAFAKLGTELGFDELKGTAGKFGLNKNISFDIPLKESTFPARRISEADTAASAIGQGRVLVTPLQMALITSCIANGGVMVQPRLVSKVQSPEGKTVKEWKMETSGRAISEDIAAKVAAMMREVVVSGTGKKAAVSGIKVAGKTGTAQNELSTEKKGNEHAWFTCFAPYEKPEIVVTVILEYSGSTGGNVAAPIAAKLIKEYEKYGK